ncbi:hypothetical protein IV203_002000 [Nitzschia inconspicua]|uniref:Uncharacterized protein n=1 Tax=Nitzschia inconspicua TaxID=303405 RepID=A0A9K3PRU6_9STRA|nr:hypothetical protein IV203_002000 [Nitzschia inconspicua]
MIRRHLCSIPSSGSDTSNSDSNSRSLEFEYPRPKHIPAPSWSISDLQLDSKQPPLPREDLDRLSRLALIDVHNKSDDEREALSQDLANMLHMIQQVTEFSKLNNDNNNKITMMKDDNTEDDLSCSSHIYDIVRGVSAAPLRKTAAADPLHAEDEQQSSEVWKKLLEPNTIRIGGTHCYFSIVTAEEE